MGAGMAIEEKRAWIGGVMAIITYGLYVIVVAGRSRGVAVADIDYAGPLVVIIGAGVVASIVVHLWIWRSTRDEANQPDERDREIDRFSKLVSQAFLAAGSLVALVLAVTDQDQFWIANAIVLGFFASAMAELVAKVVAYHRDFQSW
jgi:hypothetical protein